MELYKVEEDGRKLIYMNSQGEFFNPWDAYKPLNFFDRNKGKNYWQLRRVNDNVFNMYVRFLESGRTDILRNSQREYRDNG